MEAAFHQTRLHLTCTSNPRATVCLYLFSTLVSQFSIERARARAPPRLVFYERRVKSARDIKGLCRSGPGSREE